MLHSTPQGFRPVPKNEARRTLYILLAEDNEIDQEMAATMLRRRGHHVTVVNKPPVKASNMPCDVRATSATDRISSALG